jgi:hypothetical protein
VIGEKVMSYKNKNTDLGALQSKIEDYLKMEGFKVQSSTPSLHGVLIQAQKGGFLSDIITADRAMNVLISGQPNDFVVRIGVGRWLRHIVTAAVETLLLTELFLFVDVPEMLWNFEVEGKIARQIDAFVG